ncbi:MAG: hypothetical protein ABEI52_00720 [Halobacteriaceae archaeon]
MADVPRSRQPSAREDLNQGIDLDGYPPATGAELEVNPRHFEVDHDPVVVETCRDQEYHTWLRIRDDATRWEIGVDEEAVAHPVAHYEGGHRREIGDLPAWLVGVLRYLGVEVPER